MNLPKNAQLWWPAYAADRLRRFGTQAPAKRLWVAIMDHYEPFGGGVSAAIASSRVAAWQDRWPRIAHFAPLDAAGNRPCYTFFYPQEEYDRSVMDSLAEMSRTGLTDVEVHIHHDNDTADSFAEKIRTYTRCLRDDHGLLHDHEGRPGFAFIHGNWALDNSRPDGRWCGVNGELKVLRDLGCYADFTMPSAPSPTQSRIINQIYWATGAEDKRRGFDTGIPAAVGGGAHGTMLMVPGPLGLGYRDRLKPQLETGDLARHAPPTPYRVERWLDLAPRLGDDIFLKLFAHGAREDNAATLLGTATTPGALGPMFEWIAGAAREKNLELHWVNAFRMFSAINALIQPIGAVA